MPDDPAHIINALHYLALVTICTAGVMITMTVLLVWWLWREKQKHTRWNAAPALPKPQPPLISVLLEKEDARKRP